MKKTLVCIFTLTLLLTGCTTPFDYEVKKENEKIAKEAYEQYVNGADYWESVEDNIQKLDEDRVYWVPNGKSFHSTRYCIALSHSNTILEGTLSEAYSNGKVDPCSKCVGDY